MPNPEPRYRVLSSNFLLPQGAEVDASDLVGLRVDALIEGGHLAVVESPAPPITTPGDGAEHQEV